MIATPDVWWPTEADVPSQATPELLGGSPCWHAHCECTVRHLPGGDIRNGREPARYHRVRPREVVEESLARRAAVILVTSIRRADGGAVVRPAWADLTRGVAPLFAAPVRGLRGTNGSAFGGTSRCCVPPARRPGTACVAFAVAPPVKGRCGARVLGCACGPRQRLRFLP